MGTFIRWSLIVVAAIAFCVAAVIGGGYGLLSLTVTAKEGAAPLAGLGQPVRIYKDKHAIPHIEAANRADALRALGYLHASERLWQMEMLRRAAEGRISEIFGEQTIASDRFLRTLDLATPSRQSFDNLAEETQRLLTAYAEGVNGWIDREVATFEPRLPAEFILLDHNPEPWAPWHSIAVLKVMALTLDANMNEEIGRLALAARGFNPRQIEEIYPAGPRDTPPLLPDLRALYGFGKKGKDRSEEDSERVSDADRMPPVVAREPWPLALPASNNWVLAGSRTKSGKPLLANDPHLAFTAPTTFYLAHLRYRAGETVRNLVGGTLPGTPLVLAGRNDHLAWGLTTTYLDSQDLFIEALNPDNPDKYRVPQGYREFDRRDTVIKVKGGDDVPFVRRATRHGPVLPDGFRKLRERLPQGHVAALSWTGLAADDTTIAGALDIAHAENVSDFILKLQPMVAPMQSIVVADETGDIAVIAAGRAPVRSAYNRVAGRAPVPGWVEFYDWEGYRPFLSLPFDINPPSGAFATANANWLPADYNRLITHDWVEDFRQRRVEELFVDDGRKHSLATMVAGQADMISRAMLRFRDEALAALPQGVRLNEEIMTALAAWDGRMDKDRPEPLLMTAWHRNLQRLMLGDDLGADFELVQSGNITRMLNMLTSTGARNWCDRTPTPAIETCGEILFQAMADTLAELERRYGDNWREWRWGRAHRTWHAHRPFSEVDMLAGMFTIRAEMSGGKYTLWRNSNDFSGERPYAGVHGSQLRAIYDLADLDRSRYMISTGQSGNFLSPHYRDLVDDWAEMDYLTIPTDPAAYRERAAGVFTLSPAEGANEATP